MKKRVLRGIGGVWALALVLGGCPQPTDESKPSSSFGGTVKLSGAVHYEYDGGTSVVYEKIPVSVGKIITWTDADINGEIQDQKFSFNIGTPPTAVLAALNAKSLFLDRELYLTPLTVTPGTVKYAVLDLVTVDDDSPLVKRKTTVDSKSKTEEKVVYVYVDSDVEIQGLGNPGYTLQSFTIRVKDLNLSLKRGWNTVYTKRVLVTGSGSSHTVKRENPGLKWVLETEE